MGSFLDKPKYEKETHHNQGNNLIWALSSMQGWRVEMEDAHQAVTDIPELPGGSFFAVFDGHGGDTVSKICGTDSLKAILETDIFKAAEDKLNPDMLKDAFRQGLLDLDASIRATNSDLDSCADRSGSTAVGVIVTPTHVIFGNCGDSRAFICRNGNVVFATDDHKPTNEGEVARIKAADGDVSMGRVCGNLAVSRSLGDYFYKDMPDLDATAQKISPEADMTVIERNPEDQFMLIACDGIYDVLTNANAAAFITNQLKAGYKAEEVVERLLDYCLHLDSKDNMSAILVLFENAPKPEEGFVAPEQFPDPAETFASSGNGDNGVAQPSPDNILQLLSSMMSNQGGVNVVRADDNGDSGAAAADTADKQ